MAWFNVALQSIIQEFSHCKIIVELDLYLLSRTTV